MNKYLRKFNLNNKTSIVIGGLGLIGSNSVYALAEAGSKVIIIDNASNLELNMFSANKCRFYSRKVQEMNE